MDHKLDSVTRLFISTKRNILQSSDSWCSFLDTASRIYKYPFSDQVLIYAQNPAATAVAEFDTWVTKMNRFVRRGSKGIALIDHHSNPQKLRYVFDVSSTGKGPHGKDVNLRERQPEHDAAIQAALAREFGAEGASIPEKLIDIAAKLVLDYWEHNQADIDEFEFYSFSSDSNDIETSNKLENLQLIAANSIAYTLLRRCGYNPMDYLRPSCFAEIQDYQDENFFREFLGAATQRCASQALLTVEVSIKNYRFLPL